MRRLNNQKAEQGFVSIVVTMILMIVLTLVVLSFSQLSRREQRSALDRQLSTQAFYAAESGINDYLKALSTLDLSLPANQSRDNCNDPPPVVGMDSKLDVTNKVEYTCVLYRTKPPNLKYNNVTDSQPTIVPISNDNLSKLKISWSSTDGTYNTPLSASPAPLTTQPAWTSSAGMLRIMLIPRKDIRRDRYIDSTFNGFLYPANGPQNSSGSMDFGSGVGITKSGLLQNGNCHNNSTPLNCNMTIDNIPAASGTKGWFIVMWSIYRSPENVVLTCVQGGGAGTETPCIGAQVIIDATGKAQDVIRRVEVRKPLQDNAGSFLPLGFQTVNSICKQIVVAPPLIGDAGNFNSPPCPAF